ncbi:hypothetical protein ACVMHR_004484 [Bradyrhizobium diazoefficiens]
MVLRQPGEEISSSPIGEHRERAVILEVEFLEHRHGMENERDALLVVGNAEAVGLVTVDAERLVLQHALQVHRVHVGDQHDLLAAGALEHGVHGRADCLGRVVEAIDVGGVQNLHCAAELLELAGNALGNLFQAVDVLAARFDADEIAQRVEQRLLLLLRQCMDIGHRFRMRKRCGTCQPERCDQGSERRSRVRSGHARRSISWRMARYARVCGACHVRGRARHEPPRRNMTAMVMAATSAAVRDPAAAARSAAPRS